MRADGALAGKRLGDLRLRERHGVAVIGQWFGGLFTTAKGPDTQVQPGAILVVVAMRVLPTSSAWPCRSAAPARSCWPAMARSGRRSSKMLLTPGRPAP
ncbi:TrkA C-terminal domain-containing protein [Candidatus Skiveiella danica]|uniref:TrkA C-terminal domain-containing protein n=1 Tax=Candidatus Skiveiella danica TaxID=3386177 RepID=UPI001DCA2988|nr:TrkA C-terminal domain-containing protein [Betaproteobacteria bacterium]